MTYTIIHKKTGVKRHGMDAEIVARIKRGPFKRAFDYIEEKPIATPPEAKKATKKAKKTTGDK